MKEFNELMSAIDKGEYKPFYLLSGSEPYFIDSIENKITDKVIQKRAAHSIIHYFTVKR